MGLQQISKVLLALQLVVADATPIASSIRLSWEADFGKDLDFSTGLATHAFQRLQGTNTKVLQPVYFKFLEHYGRMLPSAEHAEVKVPSCAIGEWSPMIGVDECSN